jgi:RNase adaptor protein for sRNA GlmZ degradation
MLTLKSHGFKYSRPEANIVFDVSYFVNPWRDESIRNETNPAIRRTKILDFMNSQEGIADFVKNVTGLLLNYNALFPKENLQVAFCCSAGEYRSPSMVEMVAEELRKKGVEVVVVQSVNSKL